MEIPVLKCRVHLTSDLAVISYPLFYTGMCLDSETFVLAYLLIFTEVLGGVFCCLFFFLIQPNWAISW